MRGIDHAAQPCNALQLARKHSTVRRYFAPLVCVGLVACGAPASAATVSFNDLFGDVNSIQVEHDSGASGERITVQSLRLLDANGQNAINGATVSVGDVLTGTIHFNGEMQLPGSLTDQTWQPKILTELWQLNGV